MGGPVTIANFKDHESGPFDANGDGRADLVSGRVFATVLPGGVVEVGPNVISEVGAVGDFNGDRKSDFVSTKSHAVKVQLSKGSLVNQFRNVSLSIPPTSVLAHAPGIRFACVNDFNGDGRSDLVSRSNVFLTEGLSAVDSLARAQIPIGVFTSLDNDKTYCGDFNGDGLADIFRLGKHYINQLPAHVDRLTAVNNGGFVQNVQYKSITDNSVYTRGSGAVLPQIDMQTPMPVVSQVQSGNALQGCIQVKC